MVDFEVRTALMPEQTVLCVGDLMLDEFVYGEVNRLSPEAPALVLAVNRTEQVLGGAGNVARNVSALGARCIFVSLIGEDPTAGVIRNLLEAAPLIEPHLVSDPSRPTTRKSRFVSEHFSTHLLRADWESPAPASVQIEDALIRASLDALESADVVILSDYAKGVLTSRVIRAIIDRAKDLGTPVLVDPKRADLSVYRGSTMLTPNRKELAEACHRVVSTDPEIVEAATSLLEQLDCEAILVTRSEQGMSLIRRNAPPNHVPAHAVKVRDVSGAGDTVVAVFALMLATKADWDLALRSANAAAAVVVGKQGTATVDVAELRSRLLPHASFVAEEKIAGSREDMQTRLSMWRRQRLRIGFTNGCFDLLHPGHVKLLTEARAVCDRLVVGLNTDASVRRLKGPSRPVQGELARAQVLAALEAVDMVTFFAEDTPLELITQVCPDILIKGSDYRPEQVVGREFVESRGGQLILVHTVPGFSTTRIVHRAAAKS